MFRKSIVLLLCLVYCAVHGFTANRLIQPGQNEFFELSIIHINDFHARFVESSLISTTCYAEKKNECIGGLARVITATRQLQREQKNSIFLNAGDNYQGTIWYNIFKWNVTAYFMNKLPHDALTIGNHDFDDGVAGLVPFLQNLNFPVVVTNIDDSEEPTLQGYYKNSTVITRGNQTIGVIGVILKTTDKLSKPDKVKFLDEVETINAEADRLKEKGINIIIVLSHVGLDIDKIIAAKCAFVDIIVGGHSHSLLYSGEPSSTDVIEDEYPAVVKQSTTNRTVLIVQAAAFTKYLGNLTVWFDQHGEVVDWEGNPIFLDHSIEEDPEMLNELKPWAEVVEASRKRIIGETRTFLNNSCYSGECNLANLITDAMVHSYKNGSDNPEDWTYAAISCTNAGSIKASIPIGNITYNDLATVQPFENHLLDIELKGDDLLLAIEESVVTSRTEKYFSFPGLLHWSGVNFIYNMSMPAWSRVQDLTVKCQACKEPKFEPLDRHKWYRIIVNEFVLRGGDGLKTIVNKHRNPQIRPPLDITVLTEYIESISPVTYEIDHRMQFVGEWTNFVEANIYTIDCVPVKKVRYCGKNRNIEAIAVSADKAFQSAIVDGKNYVN